MTTDQLTAILAERILGWRLAPGRYIMPGRSWIPTWRFQPLTNIEDAFQLLDAAATSYRLEALEDGTFTAEIRTGRRNGRASGQSKAQTITTALAHALGIFPDEAAAPDSTRSHPHKEPSRSKIDGV